MAEIVEGGVFNFEVVAKNKFGTRVPVTDATVVLDNPDLGTVTVNPDGTAGVFTAVTGKDGDLNLTPAAGGVTGSPFLVSVVADSAVATVEIVPVVDPATVEIVPTV